MKILLAVALVLSVGYMTLKSESKSKRVNDQIISEKKSQEKVLKQRSQIFQYSQVTRTDQEDVNDESLDFPTIGDSIYNNFQYETESQMERDQLIGDINQQADENKRIIDQENAYENHVEQAEMQSLMIARAAEEAIHENEIRVQAWNDSENVDENEIQFNSNNVSRGPAVIGDPEIDDEVEQIRQNAQENGFNF